MNETDKEHLNQILVLPLSAQSVSTFGENKLFNLRLLANVVIVLPDSAFYVDAIHASHPAGGQ